MWNLKTVYSEKLLCIARWDLHFHKGLPFGHQGLPLSSVTKVFPSVTKVFPLVIKVFLLVTMVFPYPHPPPNIQLPPPLTSYLKLRGGTNETKRTHGPDGAQMIVLFTITDKNIFIGKDFGQKYLSKNIFFQNIIFQHLPPSDCLTQITPPLLSSSSVIFEVWVWHNKRNEGLTDRTEQCLFLLLY